MKRIAVFAAALLLAVVGAVGFRSLSDWRLLRRFEKRDPVHDARIALAAGDSALLGGAYGWGLRALPLLSDDSMFQRYIRAGKVRQVVTMSDAVSNDWELRLWTASRSYIQRYNETILASATSR